MRVYTTGNYLTARSFIKEMLEYCEKAEIWRVLVWSMSIKGERSLVESLFLLKQRIRIFFCYITSCRPIRNWNLFCKLFMLYYNRLRWCLLDTS